MRQDGKHGLMLLSPKERRARESARALLDVLQRVEGQLHSLVDLLQPIQQGEHPISPEQSTTQQYREPRPQATIRAVTELGNTDAVKQETGQKRTKAFYKNSLIVQWCLFGATLSAFGAAFWYATIQPRIIKGT